MKTKKAWYVRIHIVSDYETITDEWRVFNHLEDGEKCFNNIVGEEREIAINKKFVIEYDDNRNFEAHKKGYYERNHISVNLMYLEHLSNKSQG